MNVKGSVDPFTQKTTHPLRGFRKPWGRGIGLFVSAFLVSAAENVGNWRCRFAVEISWLAP